MKSLNVRKDSCDLDFLALGALVHRLDPGVIPFRKARSLEIHVSGGEYNVAAGLADCFRDDSVCMVEWPERVGPLLPSPDLALTFAHHQDAAVPGRGLTLRAYSEAGERCRDAIVATQPC